MQKKLYRIAKKTIQAFSEVYFVLGNEFCWLLHERTGYFEFARTAEIFNTKFTNCSKTSTFISNVYSYYYYCYYCTFSTSMFSAIVWYLAPARRPVSGSQRLKRQVWEHPVNLITARAISRVNRTAAATADDSTA